MPEARREVADRIASAHGGKVGHIYTNAIHGFSAELTPDEAAEVASRDDVLFVEEDSAVTLTGDQTSPIWSLDRIDQRALPMDSVYHYDRRGAGVHAYIIDTGIRPTHVDFEGRAHAAAGNNAMDACNRDMYSREPR